jgi:hypothetical protein
MGETRDDVEIVRRYEDAVERLVLQRPAFQSLRPGDVEREKLRDVLEQKRELVIAEYVGELRAALRDGLALVAEAQSGVSIARTMQWEERVRRALNREQPMSDDAEIVREAMAWPDGRTTEKQAAALDRILAVVEAARALVNTTGDIELWNLRTALSRNTKGETP